MNALKLHRFLRCSVVEEKVNRLILLGLIVQRFLPIWRNTFRIEKRQLERDIEMRDVKRRRRESVRSACLAVCICLLSVCLSVYRRTNCALCR